MTETEFQLLKTRRFLPLFITQFLGAFNDNIFKAALVILIAFQLVTNTHHAQLLINLAGGIFILPFFLFSATAGQLADKFDRTRIIRLVKLSEIIFMIIGAVGFYLGNLFLLMSTVFFMGTHSAFFGPIKYSIVPDLVESKEILGANGLISASTFIAILAGTIAGTEMGITQSGAIVITCIAIATAIIGFISSLLILNVPAADNNIKISRNFLGEIGRLMRYAKQHKLIFFVILEISWFWFLGFIYVTQLPVFVKEIIGGNEHVVTLFLVLFSVGIAIGSLLCNRLLKGILKTKYVPLGILGMSIFTFDLCWASSGHSTHSLITTGGGLIEFFATFSGWRIATDLLLLAISGGLYIVPLYTVMQTKCDPAFRSRIVASNNIMGALFMVLASIVAMILLGTGLSIVQLLLIMAIINCVIALYVWKKMPELPQHSNV